jgi:hypothetical protein
MKRIETALRWLWNELDDMKDRDAVRRGRQDGCAGGPVAVDAAGIKIALPLVRFATPVRPTTALDQSQEQQASVFGIKNANSSDTTITLGRNAVLGCSWPVVSRKLNPLSNNLP